MFRFIISSMEPKTRVKVARSMASTFSRPFAFTVAWRGLVVSRAISPKYIPSLKEATNTYSRPVSTL